MGLLGPHVPLCDAVVAGVTLLELENHNLTSRGPYIQKAAWASGLGSATLISAALTLSIALAALWYYNRRSVTRSSSPDPVGRVLTLGSDSPATYGSLFDTQLGAASGHASAALRERAVRRTYIIPRRDARARALTLKSLSFILLAFALLTQALTCELHKSTEERVLPLCARHYPVLRASLGPTYMCCPSSVSLATVQRGSKLRSGSSTSARRWCPAGTVDRCTQAGMLLAVLLAAAGAVRNQVHLIPVCGTRLEGVWRLGAVSIGSYGGKSVLIRLVTRPAQRD